MMAKVSVVEKLRGWWRPAPAPAAAPVPDSATADPHLAWAMQELAPWRFKPVAAEFADATFATYNETQSDIFVYRFAGETVWMDEKSPKLGTDKATANRAQKYLAFFSDVAKLLPRDFAASIAMGCSDKVVISPNVPVFCFQKRRGNRTILAPDIDFLDFNFYEGDEFNDTIPYAEKIDKAIFVGGTTGGDITVEVARACGLPRLRAAQFFQGHPRIDFLLPQIVQTTSAEAQAVLEKMPFCRPGRMGWKQQLSRRFLISIDGNGATCSRVAIALRSNSVLLKYDSDELLYYFQGLTPWLHYIPIAQDEDVEKCFDLDAWSPCVLRTIAEAGAAFGARYLTREAVTRYMAQLLLLYPACFTGDDPKAAQRRPTGPAHEPPTALFLLAHIENTGDRESDGEGWAGMATMPYRIEGFEVASSVAWWPDQVVYQAVLADKGFGPRTAGGAYCGTRGEGLPIHGFVLHLQGNAPDPVEIHYEGIFSDGFRSGALQPGTPCVSPTHAALVAMRVALRHRQPASARAG